MSQFRFWILAVPLAAATFLSGPSVAIAGGPRGGGGAYRGGYGYRGSYGYGGGVAVGISIGGPYWGYPYGYYGPGYALYAPAYYAPAHIMPAAPALSTAPAEEAPSPRMAEPGLANERPPDTTVHVTVRVPVDAEVWFGGQKTRQTGTLRQFVSPPLTTDQDYSYEVRARWMEGGKEVVQVRHVAVSAGSRSIVDFTMPDAEAIAPPKPVRP
jgi:uncharacterized protein (TIGR03000 family)